MIDRSEYKRLGWTNVCCICGRKILSWNNPEPLMDGDGRNCCEACNRLVIAERRRIFEESLSKELPLQAQKKIPNKELN